MKRTIQVILVGAVIGVFVGLLASAAFAHHPEIAATTQCTNGQHVTTLTVTSWATDDPAHRANSSIGVTLDGVTVGSGSFTAGNGYSFTVVTNVAVGSHTARATALAGFGPQGQFGSAGEWRETSFTVEGQCAVPATTLPPTTTTPPTTVTTTRPVCVPVNDERHTTCTSPTIAPPTTIPVTIIPPTTMVRPTTRPVDPPVVLAYTGTHSLLFVVLGAALLWVGVVLCCVAAGKRPPLSRGDDD